MSKKRVALLLIAVLLLLPFFFKAKRVIGESAWDGEHHINIAVDAGDLQVWSVEPAERTVSRIIIPKNTYLSLPVYGPYKAESVGRLSQLEKKDGSLLMTAVGNSLSVPIDAVILGANSTDNLDLRTYFGSKGMIEIILKRPFAGGITNLTLYDLLRLWFLSFSLKSEAITDVNISDSQAVLAYTLPDGTEGFLLDGERFKPLASKYFGDKTFKDEHLTIEIVNGTTTQGLANNLAMILTNIGGNVISTAKGEQSAQTIMYSKNGSYTTWKLGRIVGGSIKYEALRDSRADITVILGQEK